jgi:carbon monoxide dehydrogenase subunit G
MKVAQKFTVARPPAEVWAFFQDVPAVARCMPGAELTEDKGDGVYGGRVKVRLGPFGANFEGEAKVSPDPAAHSGHVEGKGVDKRGGSRTRMVMDYRLQPAGDGTEVTVDADVTLAGAIAQFGRTSLIQETANILVQDFVRALERELTPASAVTEAPTSVATAAAPMADAAVAPAPTTGEHAGAAETHGARQVYEPRVQRPIESAAPPRAHAPVRSASHEIRGGSLALRALWSWLKSLLRGLISGARRNP